MCPTCHKHFSLNCIEEHADICCERVAQTTYQAYSNLMLTVESLITEISEQEQALENCLQETTEFKLEIEEILQQIAKRVSSTKSRINVQRKFILDHYIEARK